MDSFQEEHERRVGDQLIEWYNHQHRTSFRFDGRAGGAPDLKYREGKHWLRVEVTSAYYDPKDDAKFKGAQKGNYRIRPQNGKAKILRRFLSHVLTR